MPAVPATEIVLIRHAPARAGGRLAGRSDVPADLPDEAVLAALRAGVGGFGSLVVSPALRCRQTAGALFPGLPATMDARLWEQDFGAWEGADPASLPDLGPLSPAALADHRPPGGESFAEVCARVAPALEAMSPGRTVIVAHAGVARAALALALGGPGLGLAFEVVPLSLTVLRRFPGGWSVACVNRVFG